MYKCEVWEMIKTEKMALKIWEEKYCKEYTGVERYEINIVEELKGIDATVWSTNNYTGLEG